MEQNPIELEAQKHDMGARTSTPIEDKGCNCKGCDKCSVFEKFGSKYTFVFGAIAGILTICTIGFFILLVTVFGGDSMTGGKLVMAEEPEQVLDDTDSGITVKPVSDDDHIRGNKKAKVTLIEFSDLECPYCQRFHETTKQLLEKNDDVRIVFRHFPLDSLHPEARTKAIATECAADQGKFWELLDYIFENDETSADLPNAAAKLGMNKSKFQKCLDDKTYSQNVADDQEDGIAAGVQGTPYSVIVGPNGEIEPISGALPLESIEAAIEKYL